MIPMKMRYEQVDIESSFACNIIAQHSQSAACIENDNVICAVIKHLHARSIAAVSM